MSEPLTADVQPTALARHASDLAMAINGVYRYIAAVERERDTLDTQVKDAMCQMRDLRQKVASLEEDLALANSTIDSHADTIKRYMDMNASLERDAARLRETLREVAINPARREQYYSLRYIKHDSSCRRPRGDQMCQCGASQAYTNIDNELDAAEAAFYVLNEGLSLVDGYSKINQRIAAQEKQTP